MFYISICSVCLSFTTFGGTKSQILEKEVESPNSAQLGIWLSRGLDGVVLITNSKKMFTWKGHKDSDLI